MSIYRTMFLNTDGYGLVANTPKTIIDQATSLPAELPLGACVYSVTCFNVNTANTLATGVGIKLGTLADNERFVKAADSFTTDDINDSQIMYKSITPSVGLTANTLVYVTTDTNFDDSGNNQIAFYVNYVMTQWVGA